jgi:hypothetical protein
MGIGAVSNDMSSGLMQQATNMAGAKVQDQVAVSVLKGILDQQKNAGQAIVQMIQNGPSLNGTGKIIDVRA